MTKVRQDLLNITRDWIVEPCGITIATVLPIAKSDIVLFSIPFSTATKKPNLDDLRPKLVSADSVSISHTVSGMTDSTILVRGGAFLVGDSYKISLDIGYFGDGLFFSRPRVEGLEWVYTYMEDYINKLPEPFPALKQSPTASYTCSLALPKPFFDKITVTSNGFKYRTYLSSQLYIGTTGVIAGATATQNFVQLSSKIYSNISSSTELIESLSNALKVLPRSSTYVPKKLKDVILPGYYRLSNGLPNKISCNGINEVLRISGGDIQTVNMSGGYKVEVGDVIIKLDNGVYNVEQVTPLGYLLLIENNVILYKGLTLLFGAVCRYIYNKLTSNAKVTYEPKPQPDMNKMVEQVKLDLDNLEAPLKEDIIVNNEEASLPKPVKKSTRPKIQVTLTEEEKKLSKELDDIINQVF